MNLDQLPGFSAGRVLKWQDFNSSGTFTRSPGLLAAGGVAMVLLVASGGSGAGSNGPYRGPSGGGGGEVLWEPVDLSSTASVTVTIGASVAGGAAGANGNAGNNSTFGAFLTALGGVPGTQASSPIVQPPRCGAGPGGNGFWTDHSATTYSSSAAQPGGKGRFGFGGGGGGGGGGNGTTYSLGAPGADGGGGGGGYGSSPICIGGAGKANSGGGGGGGAYYGANQAGGPSGSGFCRVYWWE